MLTNETVKWLCHVFIVNVHSKFSNTKFQILVTLPKNAHESISQCLHNHLKAMLS